MLSVVFTPTSTANYNNASASVSINVAKAHLTVTADNETKVSGAANPALTATLGGFVNGQAIATSGVTGSASCTTTATTGSPAGSYPITCTIGNLAATNYDFQPFVAGTLTVTRPTTTTLTSNHNPSSFAQSVTFTATVAPTSGAGTPNGTVIFYDGSNSIGTVTLNSFGVATLTTNGLTVGSHTITATYTGNSTWATSTRTLTQTVRPAR
jgi:hypothetical protein